MPQPWVLTLCRESGQHDIASARMLDAAAQGYRLDPRRHFPDGSFPSSVIDEVLRHAAGFNPAAEFPGGSFPRPWPFVGGSLPPPPPDPPSRLLVYQEVDGKPTVVDRGANGPRRGAVPFPGSEASPSATTQASALPAGRRLSLSRRRDGDLHGHSGLARRFVYPGQCYMSIIRFVSCPYASA